MVTGGPDGSTWQQGVEDCVGDIGAEEQPNLDAAIRDGECAKSFVLNRREHFFWDVTSERFDEFVLVHQSHLITTPEEARVIRKDTASPHD